MGFANQNAMIETIQWNTPSQEPVKPPKAVLQMVEHDRTAGSMPVWGQPKTPTQKVEQNLSIAQNNNPIDTYGSAYQGVEDRGVPEEFTFGDLVDMANPLHHIPLVNVAYREITGDTIKPIGNIVGGAVFGGAIGAAGGLVNAIVQAETGKDIGGNAVAMVRHGEVPRFKMRAAPESIQTASRKDIVDWSQPKLESGLKPMKPPQDDFSLVLLSFSDLKQSLPVVKTGQAPTYNS